MSMHSLKKPDSIQENSILLEIENKSLFSVFQPIYSFSNQACVGAEALIRGHSLDTGFQVSVSECLKVPERMNKPDHSRLINRMHLKNWKEEKRQDNWLFLNLDFQDFTNLDEICIRDLLIELQMKGHELVIEVLESEIADEVLFEQTITTLRALGCLIALDDFGTSNSNVDRIWKTQPDIVKLDRGVLLEATKSVRSESVLRNLTRLIKESGSVCLIEGVETQEQALLAMDVGVDLVQGFYFARPHCSFDQVSKGESYIRQVTEAYPDYLQEKQMVKTMQQKGYNALLEKLAQTCTLRELELAMESVVNLTFVKRFFILDINGYQVSDEHDSAMFTNRLEVLKKGKGLCWKNRGYFVKAIQNRAETHVSEPYRSLIDMQLCMTISKVVQVGKDSFIACFDVYYHDKSTESVQISV